MSDLGVIVTGLVIGSVGGIGGAVIGSWIAARDLVGEMTL